MILLISLIFSNLRIPYFAEGTTCCAEGTGCCAEGTGCYAEGTGLLRRGDRLESPVAPRGPPVTPGVCSRADCTEGTTCLGQNSGEKLNVSVLINDYRETEIDSRIRQETTANAFLAVGLVAISAMKVRSTRLNCASPIIALAAVKNE